MSFQRMDSTFTGYGCAINGKQNTIALTKSDDKKWKASFTFDRCKTDQIMLAVTWIGTKWMWISE